MSDDERAEREAMENVLRAFKAFWMTAPGNQAERVAVKKLVECIYDFREKSR